MTTNVSIKCPYGECDGTGKVYRYDEQGYLFAKRCKCEEDKILETRLQFAKIPEEFADITVKSFDVSMYKTADGINKAGAAKKIAMNYLKSFEQIKESGKGLFLYSTTRGSGKTRLAISCGNALIKHKGQRVRFITTIDLLNRIKDTYNKDCEMTEQQLINEFSEVDIVILDDIGTEKVNTWVTEKFFAILDYRMTHKKPTIITSNLDIEELSHDERIKSRLRKMVLKVEMPQEDVRGYLGATENDLLLNQLLSM